MRSQVQLAVATCLLSLGVAACSGGAIGPFIGIASPGAMKLSSSALAFTATGAANAQTVTATQVDYSGAFTASGTSCSGIATISPASGTSFTVTPVGAGTCAFTIAGASGASATLSIGVTTTTVGGS